MAAPRDKLISTINSIPIVGPAIGRQRIVKFVEDLEATVEAAAITGAEKKLEQKVTPMVKTAYLLSGVAIAIALWKGR